MIEGLVLHGEVVRGYDGVACQLGRFRIVIIKHTDVDFGHEIRMIVADSRGPGEALALEEPVAFAVMQQVKAAGATVVVTSWMPPAVLGQHAALLGILLLHSVPESEVGTLGVVLGIEFLGFSALARFKPVHLSPGPNFPSMLYSICSAFYAGGKYCTNSYLHRPMRV